MTAHIAGKIVMRRVASLAPYARNARTHSEEQIAQICASITEFGFTNPVLFADGEILAGHGRVLAAGKLGMAEVPCIDLSYLTPLQRRAYILADNKIALNAGWDEELLALELAEINDAGFDLGLTGFSDAEFSQLMAPPPGHTDPDAAPPAPDEPVSAAGDIWHLGAHRLLCGDSTLSATVEALLAGGSPSLMVTDPPYGVDYDPAWRNEAYRAGPMRRTIGAKAVGKVQNDDKADWREALAAFPGSIAYVWHGGLQAAIAQMSLEEAGFEVRAQIIWNKSILVISRGHYHWKHEACWYAVRKGSTAAWTGDRKQSTVWDIDKPKSSDTGHGTQKPIECMKRPIENNSLPGQSIYDPFCGSGTTIIAAEMTRRACFAIELSPAYVDVAVRRWEEFTGREATLDATRKTFAQTALERARKAA